MGAPKLVYCPFNHIYDAALHSECPYCKKNSSGQRTECQETAVPGAVEHEKTEEDVRYYERTESGLAKGQKTADLLQIRKKGITVFQCILMALAMMILLIAVNYMLRPVYLHWLNQDVELRITAKAAQNEDALADNVRITHVAVNGRDVDLSEVPLDKGSPWKYDSRHDFLYAYETQKETTISFRLENAHSVSVSMVKERGSGLAELQINGKPWKTVDLYKNVTWKEVKYSTNLSNFTFIEKNRKLLAAIFIILFVFWLVIFHFRQGARYKERLSGIAGTVIALWILAGIAVLLSLVIQYQNWTPVQQYIVHQPQLLLSCLVLVFLCITMLFLLSGRLWIAFMAVSVFCTVLPIISNIKLRSRGVPLLPWDLDMASTALSVAGEYDLSVTLIDVLCCAAAVGLTICLFFLRKKERKIRPAGRISSVLFLIMVLFFIQSNFIGTEIEENNTEYRVYQVDSYYLKRGFIPAFFEYFSYLDFNVSDKPEGYSREKMENIVKEIGTESPSEEESRTPTIIAVMDESFWDVERLDTVDFSEEVLPNLNSLKSESCYGTLFTHALNGGTITTEFEFLTGFSGEFFPEDYMVYGSCLYKDFASAVSVLESQGYRTTAIHPYKAGNYNRENAYENFGFDRRIFNKDFKNPGRVRGYISDESAFDRVIEEYEKNRKRHRPQFIFTVTMQNHGGYWEEKTNQESAVSFKTDQYGEVARACMSDYFSGLHASDQALGELVEYFRHVDENVIIVYFGDHMSDAGPKDDRMFGKTSWNESSIKFDYETHTVPFIVWNNYEQDHEDWGTMGAGELLPSVLDAYDIGSNDFWKYLVSLRDFYSASDRMLVVNKDGSYAEKSDMTKKQIRAREVYELLQYDYIWGEQYASELWRTGAQ